MIVLMGLAGSGKGTQAKMLVDKDHYSLISTGDLLRNYASDNQKKRMVAGVLLKDEEIYELINKALQAVQDMKKCLIDGTPRSIPQAKWLMDQMNEGRFGIEAVLHLEVSESVVRQRLLKRGRSDDTESGITKRFEEYHRATVPIIDYLKASSIHVYTIDANKSPEATHQDIVQILRKV